MADNETLDGLRALDVLPEYEGWHNKPTWAVALWINNEQGPYEDVRAIVRDHIEDAGDDEDEARYTVEDALRTYVGEYMVREDQQDASLGSDLLTWALAVVDWRELAESFMRDARENAEYEAANR